MRRLSQETRTIFSNVAALGTMQALNYILPLVVLPYLLRTVGTERYGLLAFATAFAAYFRTVVDYGFHLTATRQVSLARSNPAELAEVYNATITAKVVLCLLCAVIFLPLMLLPRFSAGPAIFFAAALGVPGSCLLPTWFFQGVERMSVNTIINLGFRIPATAMVFLLVKGPDDIIMVPIINGVAVWIGGFASILVVRRKFGICLSLVRFSSAWRQIQEGFVIFVSQFAVTLYTFTNTFLLGFLADNTTVGRYAVADRIVRATVYLSAPLCTAVYPRVGLLMKQNRAGATAFLRKMLLWGSAPFGLLSAALFFLADPVTILVKGAPDSIISGCIRILAILPLSVFVDNIYGTQILLNVGRQKELTRSVVLSGLLSLSMLLYLAPAFGAVAAAVSYLTAELAILFLFVVHVRRAGITLLGRLF